MQPSHYRHPVHSTRLECSKSEPFKTQILWPPAPESSCFILCSLQFVFSTFYLTLLWIRKNGIPSCIKASKWALSSWCLIILDNWNTCKQSRWELVMASGGVLLEASFFYNLHTVKVLIWEFDSKIIYRCSCNWEDPAGELGTEQSILAGHICFQRHKKWWGKMATYFPRTEFSYLELL